MLKTLAYSPFVSVQQNWRRLRPDWTGAYDYAEGSWYDEDMSGKPFRNHVQNKFNSTFSARRTVVHSLGTQAGYSSHVSGSISAPEPVKIEYILPKVKNSNSGWRLRKKELSMIVSNYASGKITAIASASEKITQKEYQFESFCVVKYFTGIFDKIVGKRCYIIYGGVPYFLEDWQAIAYGSLYHYETSFSLTPPFPVAPDRLYDILDSSREKSNVLVTATVAEANKNSVDVLTAAAELPETVRETFGALRSIGRIISDVKKKRFALSNSFLKTKERLSASYRKQISDIEQQLLDPRLSSKRRRSLEAALDKKRAAHGRDLDKAASEFGDALADLWLWLRYSLSPNLYLIDDCLDAMNALHAVFDTARDRENVETKVDPIRVGNSYQVKDIHISTTHRCMVKRKYVLDTVMPRNIGQVMSANLATTAWELLSRSLVVDWVLNVGDLLTACLPTDLDYLDQVATYSFRESGYLEYTHRSTGGVITYHIDLYKREVINPVDYLGLCFRPALTLFRSIDAAAMLWPTLRNQLRNSK